MSEQIDIISEHFLVFILCFVPIPRVIGLASACILVICQGWAFMDVIRWPFVEVHMHPQCSCAHECNQLMNLKSYPAN